MRNQVRLLGAAVLMSAALSMSSAETPRDQQLGSTDYRLSFPNVIHHQMNVSVTFRNLAREPLHMQMSRSSPGRYAAVEFVKNVSNIRITDETGMALTVSQSTPRDWVVSGHSGTVQVSYTVFGDRVDGTFLAVDNTHAHINLPSALMWAHGLESYPAHVTFMLPPGLDWKVATQLYPSSDPLTFTAPNLQYLMDSPVELSNFAMRTFSIEPRVPQGSVQTIRIVMHQSAAAGDLDGYAAGLKSTIREEQAIFGELPKFEPGYYTLLADFQPWNQGDGMEHRNSSVVTGKIFTRNGNPSVRGATHEFFHCWNIRRIRPAGLEPYNFADVNLTGELWMAEGFTNYYERLVMVRSGLENLDSAASELAGEMGYVLSSPGARTRSAEDMSRLAPLTDSQVSDSSEPTDLANTFVSYYSMGDMIALGLDLTLRARSDSKTSLDDVMRAMWEVYGAPGFSAPGLVSTPYTIEGFRARLADVSGSKSFADEFVSRYIQGTEKIDYAPLLLRAGLVLRKKNPGQGTLGSIAVEKRASVLRVKSPVPLGSPAFLAGIDLDDELVSIENVALVDADDISKVLKGRAPGERVGLTFRRRGQEVHATATLAEDELLELLPIETTGAVLTPEQTRFRNAWLQSKVSH